MGLLIAINVENGIDMLKNSSEVKMINQTLLKIRELREDISEYLFHFTKGEDAFETLQKILDEGKLRSFNEDSESKGQVFDSSERYQNLRPHDSHPHLFEISVPPYFTPF